ncbi:Metallo-dependent phosphatase-like protein [Scleroderma citrinum]
MSPSRPAVVNVLRFSWVLVVLWYELGVFDWALRDCHWPDSRQPQSSNSRIARILVIADPQILDNHSYPERGSLLSSLSQIIVDLNLRKSWHATFGRLKPDAVVVLGDMMDNGRVTMSVSEYKAYHARYSDIFKMVGRSVPTYYLPGNHDIGLGQDSSFSLEVDSRFTSHFGPRNHRISIGNYTLVFIDAPALAEEDVLRANKGHTFESWPAVPHGAIEFVKQTAESRPEGPVILFTHIPLARPLDGDCGPLRERGTIQQGFGFGYQNTLMDGATEFLLDRLNPSLILSGDDHDYCDYQHTIPSTNAKVREVTVKSLSMAMGIRRPGFQLLSLVSTVPLEGSLTQIPVPPPLDAPCLLPDQLGIYLYVYLPLSLLSLVLLLVCNIWWSRQPLRHTMGDRQKHQNGTYELPHHLHRGSSPGSADYHYDRSHSPSLPTPVTKPRSDGHTSTRSRGKSWSSTPWTWKFKFGNQRRRITFPLLSCRTRDPYQSRRDQYIHEPGVLGAFGKDILSVGGPPLCVFLLAAWWSMR